MADQKRKDAVSHSVTLLVIGALLFLIVGIISTAMNEHLTASDSNFIGVLVAGEGVEGYCACDVATDFDDKGHCDIAFSASKDDKDSYAWVFIENEYPFTWDVSGEVAHMATSSAGMDSSDYSPTGMVRGEGDTYAVFRVHVRAEGSDECIHLALGASNVIKETPFTYEVRTPWVVSAQQDFGGNAVQHLNELRGRVSSIDISEYDEHELGDLVSRILADGLSAGRIGDVVLMPALMTVTGTYSPKGGFLAKDDLKPQFKPSSNDQFLGGATWQPCKGQLCPIVKYVKTGDVEFMGKFADVLYAIAGFLVSTGGIDLILLLTRSSKDA